MVTGWKSVYPSDEFQVVPMSDGGDGFGPVVGEALGAKPRSVSTVDAAGRKVRSTWWFHERSRTAVIETARTIGLAMLEPGRFHPFELDTLGLANVLSAARRAGTVRYLIGIGGSATNDGGFGLARGLGWRFWDRWGRAVEHWKDLVNLRRIKPPSDDGGNAPGARCVAVDVSNPLLGSRGCSRIYGPQKGLRAEDMAAAEAALRRLSLVLRRQGLRGDVKLAGAGAAGGLGFGLHAFWGAELRSGFEIFAESACLEERLTRAQLVVTGEGSIDPSSLMGKGVGEIVRRCGARGIPCIGLGGVVSDRPEVRRSFDLLMGMGTHLATPEEARSRPAYWLRRLARQAALRWESMK